jgi:dihydrofolate reductase
MAKLIHFNLITLDGFFEGPNQDISWHNVDEAFNDFALAQLEDIGTLLFGRVTYEMMASYWPTPAALENDPQVAGKMNAVPKVVFSRTLERADWQSSRLVRDSAAAEVARLKQTADHNLYLFGSSDLAVSLMPANLIDEFRIIVCPVLLGQGKQLFAGLETPYQLKLLSARPFQNGNVLMTYTPA